jgi:hypothetical protein
MSLAWVSDQPRSSDMEMQLSPRAPAGTKTLIQVFFYLQALDFLTTLIGLKLGIPEASPFIRSLMQFGPSVAVAASKIAALILAAVCIKSNRSHLLRYANYWFAGVVVWNLLNILIV